MATKVKLVGENGTVSHTVQKAWLLKNKVVVAVAAFQCLAAYTLSAKDQTAKWLGYVGSNGPSRGKVKNAAVIDLEKLRPQLRGKAFEIQ